MMPYDTYRLYQVERARSTHEIHHADRRAARLSSAVSGLFRAITQTARRPHPAAPAGRPVTRAGVLVPASPRAGQR
jgi:hypothetical protein